MVFGREAEYKFKFGGLNYGEDNQTIYNKERRTKNTV